MASLFTKIIQGEIPSYKVAEDEFNFAFLDISPVSKGHTLVVPKKEVDYIYDLDEASLASLHLFSKKVAVAIKKAFPCERICVMVLGFDVPHTHVHLIPANSMADTHFGHKIKLSESEMMEIAEKIRAHFV